MRWAPFVVSGAHSAGVGRGASGMAGPMRASRDRAGGGKIRQLSGVVIVVKLTRT